MSFSPWLAVVDGRVVRWTPDPPHVTGDDSLVPAVLAELDGRGIIALSPTGPFVKNDPADPLAVLGALREIGHTVQVSASGPRLPGLATDSIA